MNLQEELKALKERIAELEEQAKEEQEFPKVGDEYWYMGVTGEIFISKWNGYDSEESMLKIGNIFRTEEEAQCAAEKLKVEAELRKFSRPFEEDENNYFIQIDSSYKGITIEVDDYYQTQGTIYFESEEKAQQAISTVGEERIKKYIFGVED